MKTSNRLPSETLLACTIRKRLKIFDIPMDVFTSIYGNRVIYSASDMVDFIDWYVHHHNVFHQHHRSV